MTTESLWAEALGEGAPPPPEQRRKRPLWPWALLALVLAVGVYAWLGRGPAPGGVLNVGSQRGGTKALLLASGVLKGAPYTVEWSEFPAAQNLQEAIGAGAVDVGLASDAPFLFAYQSGQPIGHRRAGCPPQAAQRARHPCSRSLVDPRRDGIARQDDRHHARIDRPLPDPARAGR